MPAMARPLFFRSLLLLHPLALLCLAAASPQCGSKDLYANSCVHDSKSRIGPLPTLQAKDAAACCEACGDHRECKAWTFWGENSCNLFSSDAEKGQEGDCTSSVPAGKTPSSPWVPPVAPGPACTDCPNIIFCLTDDQDILLEGWKPMKQTQRLLQATGAVLTEWRIHTPICSPSRSETVSGRYFHNIKSSLPVPQKKVHPAATAHVNGTLYHNASFANYLRQQRGYQTALFGKSNFNINLDENIGFDRWFEGASLGYGNTWNDNESPDFKYKAGSDEYATSLLGNKTIEWIKRDNVTGKTSGGRPFFAYFAPHCPHIPSTPPKWYEDACPGVASPRTPNYNWSTPLFHELIAGQPPLTLSEASDIDTLARLRCQCLMSVDDSYAQIYQTLVDLGIEDNTYWVITSDHGYNLGQHRLPSNKFLLYEHSLRIPLVVKGPGVPQGVQLPIMGTNVDYAPTWLALADIETPATMDGRQLASAIVTNLSDPMLPGATRRFLQKNPPLSLPSVRKEQFVQYYSQGHWQPNDAKDGHNRTLDDYSNTYIGLYINDTSLPDGGAGCFKYGEYQYVCTSDQIAKFQCFENPDFYELFDLSSDPYEMHNIYQSASADLTKALHARLRQYYPCKGKACP